MLKKYFKLTVGLLMVFILFGFSKGKYYPKEQWFVIQAELDDGRPIVGSANGGYRNYPHKATFPWSLRLHIGLNLDDVGKDGLPLKQEKDIVQKMEDELLKAISKRTMVHNIGHLYNDSFLDVYAYIEEPKEAHAYLQSRIQKEDHVRGFGYEITKDPLWNEVSFILGNLAP